MDPAQAQQMAALQAMLQQARANKPSKPLKDMTWIEWLQYKGTVQLPQYSQTAIYYGWLPIVAYVGLSLGTHKYFPEENMMVQKERPARFTDCIPIPGIGTNGLP